LQTVEEFSNRERWEQLSENDGGDRRVFGITFQWFTENLRLLVKEFNLSASKIQLQFFEANEYLH